ncbi:uncharacterized protein EDB91DRAFT_1158429, partial [Suillus paluster]|uniref:uncharacterized protein n=1 Tax=Suillus paluster TaxID=48578 RepID=UPI001B87FB85
MSTPPGKSTSPRLSSSPSSSPSHSHSLLTRTRPLSFANVNQSFSTLPPESIPSVHSSPGHSTIDLSHTDPNTRTPTGSYPIRIRYHSPAPGGGHGSTSMRSARTIANTPRDSILLSPASTSRDTKWWSRSPSNERRGSASPSRGRRVVSDRSAFSVVSRHRSDASLLFDDVEREVPFPSLSHADPPLPPLSSDLPSISREDLQIRDLGEKSVCDEESLLLSSPESPSAILGSPTLPIVHRLPRTLRSLGVGIEEDIRDHDIENSFWPKLFGMSPKSSPSPLAELGTSASPSETILQVDEQLVVSMETWDGESLNVSPVAMSSSPAKGKVPALPNKAVSSTSPVHTVKPSAPTPQERPESWRHKFTRHQSPKGREKERNHKDSWLRAREVSFVYFVFSLSLPY